MANPRWSETPRQVRLIVAGGVVVFSYGTVVHLVQLAVGGTNPYPALPPWLAAYFLSLTALDPLAAGLLLSRRSTGLLLGRIVLVTDVAANGYANYVLDRTDGVNLNRIGHAVVTVLAVALMALAPYVRPWLRPAPARPAGA